MPKSLEGKVALITGGSRGIGAAIAKRLASDGANVTITYTKGADAAESVVKEIERAGRKAIAIQADAADADAVKAAVEKIVTTFGQLDILVNNAGTAVPKRFRLDTWPRALLGYKGSDQDVHSGVVQRSRDPRHYGKQYPTGSDRHGFESRRWRLGGTAEGGHSARSLWEG